jgi:hypothetical protein
MRRSKRMQVKRTHKKRTHKKRTHKKRTHKKMLGGNPTFTVMTFNVECWLNQIKTHDKSVNFKNFMTGKSEENPHNWQQMKDLFNGVDIASIQENAVIKQGSSFTNFIENIGDLKLNSSCQSHDFHWPQTQELYGIGNKISNSVYSRYDNAVSPAPIESQLTENNKTTIDTSGKPHPRCWAISTLTIPVGVDTRAGTNTNNKEIRVASIHLTGGRQDDTSSLDGDNFIIKIRQMHELIKENPSIICLDSNTKLPKDWTDIQSKENSYLYTDYQGKKYEKYFLTDTKVNGITVQEYFEQNLKQLYLDENPDSDDQITLDRIYELINIKLSSELNSTELIDWNKITLMQKWYVWMYGLDRFMKEKEFKSIYDLTGLVIKDTTIYGGTVDAIYYKDNIELKSVEFVDGVIDMSKPVSKFPDYMERKVLSDHAPVKAVFSFVE